MTQTSAIESTIRGITNTLSRALDSERLASHPGFLQGFDPRAKLVGTFALVTVVVLSRRISVILGLLLLAVLIATMSGVHIFSLAKRVWLVVFAFTGLVAAPAIFITPGDPIFTVPWIHMAISGAGLRAAAFLVLRAEAAVTLTTVLVLCTPWNGLLKALRMLRVPPEAVTVLAMTHRYLFLLIGATNQLFEARRSRHVGHLTKPEQRRMMTSAAGVLLSKSVDLSQDIYLAMLSRGFSGEVRLLSESRMKTKDYVFLTAFFAIATCAIWFGR